MGTPYRYTVGIDWATQAHQVCVLDAARQVHAKRSVEHSGLALGELATYLEQLAPPGGVAIAIEVPHGPVVETLVERGFPVFAINPKQLDRFRDRYSVAGAKDDSRDAFVLADSLCTDEHCFRRVALVDPVVLQVRELVRVHAGLREEQVRLGNQLRAQLYRYYPQLLQLSPAMDEPWLWDLLELAPTPAAGARLTAAPIARLLRARRIRRLTAAEVMATLRTPALTVAPGTPEAAATHLALLLPRLRLVRDQDRELQRQLEQLLQQLGAPEATAEQQREYRDQQLLRSMPGAGLLLASTLLAEAAQPLAARDYPRLRSLCGVAPVTRQSGKCKQVIMRHACNGRLRDACYHWARVATQRDAAAKAHCAALRERGHSYGRALRSVVDRLLCIYLAMLAQNTPYDPSRPRGATRAPPLPSGAQPDDPAPLPPHPATIEDEPT